MKVKELIEIWKRYNGFMEQRTRKRTSQRKNQRRN